ncbi:phage integrase family protein [Paraburkholderia sp. 40]|uniref:phage integrase family protein n=1 Tax=Paraburkholderia sp. 40 TaxID=2991059 RepID=UPI003D1CD26A
MANRSLPITLTRAYSRTDFTALRAFVQRVPPATIARLYFSEDRDGNAPTAGWVSTYLRQMQADLVDLAIEHGSPVLADHLKASARAHGSARLTAVTLKMVEQAAALAVARPDAQHPVGMWFRPLVSLRLKGEGIRTLGDLVAFCNRRGGSWWRPVPRIGASRARHIVAWLRQHEASIGERVVDDVELEDPLVAADLVVVDGPRSALVPLERMTVSTALSGTTGANRSSAFPFIQARNDLDAVRAYLNRYRDQPKTLRVYTKELERFLLWAVAVRGKPMSALMVEDCEAYKDFLALPSPSFVGPRAPRSSPRWRPFATDALTPESQRYATRALRAAFAWLVDVRYLAGNPWKAVNDPRVVKRETSIRIDRALPRDLWERARAFMDGACRPVGAKQWRIARALLLLMGASGLRREEAAGAVRARLVVSPHSTRVHPVWQLTVIGKRNRERTVPVSPATVSALRAHWRDRGEPFDGPHSPASLSIPLLAPLVVPNFRVAEAKHANTDAPQGYSTHGVWKLVRWAMTGLLEGMDGLSEAERMVLHEASPHAFRHTFGTHAAGEDVPIDVIQRALGHASMQTTSIYVQAEQRRMAHEFERFYASEPDLNE